MVEKFKLKKKRIDVPTLNQKHKYYYPEEDIQEFMEILKEEIANDNFAYPLAVKNDIRIIDKLTGF